MYPNLKYNISLEDKILESEIINQINLDIDFFNSIYELEKVLSVYVEKSKVARKNSNFNFFPIIDFAIHLNTLLLDHKVSNKYLSNSKTEWEKRYFIRIISILIYEAINDIPVLLGKKFRETLANEVNYKGSLEELKNLNSSLFQFKSKYLSFLKKIRNITFAHRDQESHLLINEILNLNFSESIDLCGEFDEILRNYGGFIQKILKIAPS